MSIHSVLTPTSSNVDNDTESIPINTAESPPDPICPPPTKWSRIKAFCLRHWFFIGMMLAIALAAAYPKLGRKGGPLKPEYSIKYGGISLIFFLSGLGLKSHVLARTFLMWKIHLVIQVLSLGVIPALGFGFSKLFIICGLSFCGFNSYRFIVCLSMPTTISSNVVMTAAAKGNEAAALINATIGNILGIIISPALLLGFLGTAVSISPSKLFFDLGLSVLLPLVVGQIVRFAFTAKVDAISKKVNFSRISSVVLLLLVYSTFCDTFSGSPNSNANPSAGAVALTILFCFILYPVFSMMCYYTSRIPIFRFTRSDSIAVVYCGATKTMALGLPLLQILYQNDDRIGIVSLPLLIYHATQLTIGGSMVGKLRQWESKDPNPSSLS
ncbi:putative sodium bile acid cotransporter [Paraphysoderma sedebokerense]|nr:putative sodium bile acid cotransporter [Paraphysoderma sedebokerense]